VDDLIRNGQIRLRDIHSMYSCMHNLHANENLLIFSDVGARPRKQRAKTANMLRTAASRDFRWRHRRTSAASRWSLAFY